MDKLRAIVDDVQYGANVDVTFAVRHDKVDAVKGRITEMFASRAAIETVGERYDADPE